MDVKKTILFSYVLVMLAAAVGCDKEEKQVEGEVYLVPELEERYTITDTAGLPEEFHNVIPLWENVWGGTRYEPMTVTRVYPDGSYYTYDNNRGNEEYAWALLGEVSQEGVNKLRNILRSEEFQSLESDGGEKRKVGSVERIYRVHVDGTIKELIYAKDAADRPEVFGTIFDTILQALVK